MANRKMRVPTAEEYKDIITTILEGTETTRPNPRVAFILQLQATLCLRVGDILTMTPNSIIRDGERYRLDITEEKTGKERHFTVDTDTALKIKQYATDNNIKSNEKLFPVTERAVQKHLTKVCDLLAIQDINTHSFRKFGATNIYNNNGKNIVMVQQILQHSSPTVTQRYIGVQPEEVEQALKNNNQFI